MLLLVPDTFGHSSRADVDKKEKKRGLVNVIVLAVSLYNPINR